MNKDDIKKAIKCCFDYNCAECPNAKIKGYGCKDKLHADALNLITEQEKDIKQLKTECALLDDELRIARQNTIDVLNELKDKSYVNDYCREVVEVEKIDELIKEIEK